MKKKIKTCYVISSLARGGPVNVLYNIVRLMDPTVYDISIITLVPENEANRVDDFKKLPIRLITVYGTGLLKPFSLYLNLKRALAKEMPDLIHSHCPRSLLLMGFIQTKGRQLLTIHNHFGLLQIIMYGPVKGRIVTALSKYFIKRIDVPIACAENVRDALLENDRIKVEAIPNCGSFLPTTISDFEKSILRKKMGLKDDITYFIFIGRLAEEKNIEFLVKAFKKLKLHNVGLILLGEGALKGKIEANSFENMVMPGFVENVKEYILSSDYYVSSSLTEGLANTLLETMALGLPFILSDIAPHFEVYNKSTEFMGVIFKNNSELDFEKKLKELLSYPHEKAANEVRKCFSEYYTPEKMSIAYQKHYNDLIIRMKNGTQ